MGKKEAWIMELQQLKYFKAAADIGKISEAAERLFVSAPDAGSNYRFPAGDPCRTQGQKTSPPQ